MNEFEEFKETEKEWNEEVDITTNIILFQFKVECPNCMKSYNDWRLLPPIQVINEKFHLVKYECQCGEIFKKIEDAREDK
ncbi:hypothetical protein [Sporohalobacter salinus]|uniref:hypothetical protein n=1 Tax=Sporohalobacter salinus TaxID=1494606 RepID=UPI001960E0F1|nr:hypothetical protein [Sporohalobacter salinus]MBM7624083.1 hypothetical protein [Sporohalobacter salinus]